EEVGLHARRRRGRAAGRALRRRRRARCAQQRRGSDQLRIRRPARGAAPAPGQPRLPAHLVQMTAARLAAECGAILEPLETAANAAWWEANVDARDET